MGRVNSTSRLLVAQDFGCDSADGTYLLHELQKGTPADEAVYQMTEWLRAAFAQDQKRTRAELQAAGVRMTDPEVIQNLKLAGWIW